MKVLRRAVFGVSLLVGIALCSAAAANTEHTVQKGETLYHISRLYGVPVAILEKINNIQNARGLRAGTRIEIPQTYRVKKGDTLYSIAKDNGVSLARLLSLNHIGKNDLIKVGQVLVLPSSGHAIPTSAPTAGSTSTGVGSAPTGGTPAGGSGGGAATAGGQGSGVDASAGGAPFWPATGHRTFLSGKLAGGTQIVGQAGDPVYTVAAGRVVWVGPYRGYGRVVFVQSPAGYIYVYGGNETTLVKVGETVGAGTQVANMGVNPHLGQACAYFFVYKNGKPVNPRTAPRG